MSEDKDEESKGLLYKFALTILFVSTYASGVLAIGAYSYGQAEYPEWLAFSGFGVLIFSILMVAAVFVSFNTDWDTIRSDDSDEDSPAMTTEELEQSKDASAGKPTPSLEKNDEEDIEETETEDDVEDNEAAVNLDNAPTPSKDS